MIQMVQESSAESSDHQRSTHTLQQMQPQKGQERQGTNIGHSNLALDALEYSQRSSHVLGRLCEAWSPPPVNPHAIGKECFHQQTPEIKAILSTENNIQP